MTSTEFVQWKEYYRLEPFGEERADYRMGVIASILANVNRRKKTDKQYSPKDFMPVFNKEKKRKQTWQEQLQVVERMNKVYGGVDKRKN